MKNRKSGILLHITSLPGIEGIGTLGINAFKFVDFLAETKQTVWQILPLGPVGFGNSPYQCYSAFAGNPLLIDLEALVEEGLLNKKAFNEIPNFSKKRVQFSKVESWKYPLLRAAFKYFKQHSFNLFKNEYEHFLDVHGWWLHDYCLFMAAKSHFKSINIWSDWPDEIKFRKKQEIEKLSAKLLNEIDFQKFLQFIFFKQWFRLKKYANKKQIKIIGDVPLYVSGDSSDVWTNPDIFVLDADLKPTEVGGVPPDYFSEDGQLWGNPVFNWERLKEREYDWWMARLHFNLNMFNEIRIDHFRGLESFWSVPANHENAKNGKWVAANGYEMLKLFQSQIGDLPLIAEDLGIITAEVEKLRYHFELPGMKVLQFAFLSDAENNYLPHNFEQNSVVYTGTHDNDTTLGWLLSLKNEELKMFNEYISESAADSLQNIMKMAAASVAKTAIFPMQDVLELDGGHRMNIPGTATGNWEWRFQWNQLKQKHKKFVSDLTVKYNRY